MRVPLDVAFLLDVSGSLYQDNYAKEKQFVKNVINAQTVGKDDALIGLISYSNEATSHAKFSDNLNKAQLSRTIDDIPFEGNSTRIDKALETARTQLFTEQNGARDNAKRVCMPHSFFSKHKLFLRVQYHLENTKDRISWSNICREIFRARNFSWRFRIAI